MKHWIISSSYRQHLDSRNILWIEAELLELFNLPVGGTHVPCAGLTWLKDWIWWKEAIRILLGQSSLTDFLQFFILIPLRLGFVFLVSLFLLCVVSIHHLLIWCLKKITKSEEAHNSEGSLDPVLNFDWTWFSMLLFPLMLLLLVPFTCWFETGL